MKPRDPWERLDPDEAKRVDVTGRFDFFWVVLDAGMTHLERGQLYGLIRFGSRTDLLLPKHVSICVKPGDRVRGGETIIARY